MTPNAEEELRTAIDDALTDERAGCWCSVYRKRCEFHSGAEAGAEVAMAVIYATGGEVVASWLAGA